MQLFCCKKKDQGATQYDKGSKQGPPANAPRLAWCLINKSKQEIAEAWQFIFERRWLQEPRDDEPISDPFVRGNYPDGMHEFLKRDLTPEQRKLCHRQKLHIFFDYLQQAVGGKNFSF